MTPRDKLAECNKIFAETSCKTQVLQTFFFSWNTINMNALLFCDVIQLCLIVADVSGLPNP
jgi:hypothetical protein